MFINETAYSQQTLLTVTNGDSPYIKDGFWWIGNTPTDIKAEGKDGETPTLSIDPETGHWIINGVDSGISSKGMDGDTTEFAYYLYKNDAPSKPEGEITQTPTPPEILFDTWTDSP